MTLEQMYKLEESYDWDYVESEGGMAVRYDFGSLSLWIYSSGTCEGHCPKSLKEEIESIPEINVEFLKYV